MTGRFDARLRRMMLAMKHAFEKEGHSVFLAIQLERWGKHPIGPVETVERDYRELAASDVVVSLPGNPPSGGCHVELGWASALQKPIVLLLKPQGTYSPLVLGIHGMTRAHTVYVTEHPTPKETRAAVAEVMSHLVRWNGSQTSHVVPA